MGYLFINQLITTKHMKKITLIIGLLVVGLQFSNAQVNMGVKAGINYNNNGDLKLADVVTNAIQGADAKTGFHAGLWFRAKLPMVGLYLRPEVIYTQVKSQYYYKSTNTSYDFKKIDVPILLGKKFLKVATIFAGPSFQYVLNSNFGMATVNEISLDKFSLGLQSGFGIEINKIGVDVRWERGLTKTEAIFADGVGNFTIDNRTNQIILGFSYKF